MVYHAWIMLMFLVLNSGCVSNKMQGKQNKPVLIPDIYAQSVGDAQRDAAKFIEENLKEQKTFGYIKPYIPVIQEPVVRKVWIPDHKERQDASVLVGGHWVYLMIQGPKWFIEDQTNGIEVPVIVPAKPGATAN